MRRLTSLLVILPALWIFSAYKPISAPAPCPVNSTMAPWLCPAPDQVDVDVVSELVIDSTQELRVLMLNYSAYDSVYAIKMRRFIRRNLPNASCTSFWDGSPADLQRALSGQQVVMITYPTGGQASQIQAYGKILNQFVQRGGSVVFTGTHEFNILQHYGLIELDYGYFCEAPELREIQEHPIFSGTSASFVLKNYAYPLDISDAAFVTLADVRGYPVLGYKPIGKGKVVYLGLEYYYDEPTSTRILINTLQWLSQPRSSSGSSVNNREVRNRSEEILFAGSGRQSDVPALKIYPNPYFAKANLDFELSKTRSVAVDMTDETGRLVAVLLPRRNLNSGTYRLELPNVEPGVYFVQCQFDGETTVRQVVKTASN
ncbi:MAG: T9SS type A sorting domain-containing protein [Saprospiraceae bacterium]|nr:T9SS type A sorting domain-containing protein [Saprospiraceae bacterium]